MRSSTRKRAKRTRSVAALFRADCKIAVLAQIPSTSARDRLFAAKKALDDIGAKKIGDTLARIPVGKPGLSIGGRLRAKFDATDD